MSDVTYIGELRPQDLVRTLLCVEEWIESQREPVSEADVVEIVNQYEGYVEPDPFVPMATTPVFVERRKAHPVS